MAMAAHWGMTTARTGFRMVRDEIAARLRLVQILSPAFPIGAFAHSQGLETAIADGRVTDAGDLQDWIAAVLTQGSARSDAIFLSMARRPGADLAALADLFEAWLQGRRWHAVTERSCSPHACLGRFMRRLVVVPDVLEQPLGRSEHVRIWQGSV